MYVRIVLVLTWLAIGCQADAQSAPEDSSDLPPIYRELGVSKEGRVDADSSLSLTEVMELVVARNPIIAGTRAERTAALGRLKQSTLRPNPQLSAEVEDFGRKDRSGPTQTTIGIELPFELFGKRSARRAAAEAELGSGSAAAQLTLLELYRSVASSFASALGAQQRVALATERLALARRIEEAANVKVNDGAVPRSELLRARSITRLTEIDLSSADAAARQERLTLAALWGSTEADFRIEGSLEDWLLLPESSFDAITYADNSELQHLEAHVEAREAEVRLAKTTAKPDLSLGAGYRRLHDEGSNAFLVWAAIPLPLFNRNQGGTAEAVARVTSAQAQLAAARQRVARDIRQKTLALTTQRQRVDLLRHQVIPSAEDALRETDLAYRLGSQPYIDVLDAQRTLHELQGMLIDALVAGAQIAVELEQLTAHRLTPPGR